MGNGMVGFGDGTLKSAGQLLIDARQRLNTENNTFKDEVEGLKPYFQGNAALALDNLGRAWADKYLVVLNKLDAFDQSLNETERGLTTVDDASASATGNIQSRMDGIGI